MRPVNTALAIVLLAVSSVPASAQLMRDHDARSMRSFHGAGAHIRRSFKSDAEADSVLRRVLAAAGLSGMEDRIILRASAETSNAEAFVEKKDGAEERLIFYNAVFMQDIAAKTQNYWSMVAILAHEVGHHVRFHTVLPGREHEFELEADYQAGFILRRMGATLAETQSAFRTFPVAATASHPGRDQRLQMVTLGWTDGGGGSSAGASFPVANVPAPTAPPPRQAPPRAPAPDVVASLSEPANRSAAPPEAGAAACASTGGLRYCVSSVLPTAGVNTAHYGPKSLFDGDPGTSWVESKAGVGVGEWILVSWPDERPLTGLRLVNGYAKSRRLFEINGRVERAELAFSDGSSVAVTLRTDASGEQVVRLSAPKRTRWVRITIRAAIEGNKYADTSISELRPVFD